MTVRRALSLIIKTPRMVWRTTLWALGLRQYSWTVSPPHRVLSILSRRVYARRATRYWLAYNVLAALLKHRERLYADKMNFVARLGGPTTGSVLRNALLWQHAILQNPELPPTLKVHGILRLSVDPEHVRLDRLMSLLLLSDVFANLNVVFDGPDARRDLTALLTESEARRAGPEAEFDLEVPRELELGRVAGANWRRILPIQVDARRSVTSYLKAAHPGAFIVAVGLPEEDDDGFCDMALEEWKSALRSIASDLPQAVFCVLNRTGRSAWSPPGATGGAGPRWLALVREAGLQLADAIALAQMADAFIGQADVFGIAARVAGRPGVYMDPLAKAAVPPGPDTCVTEPLSPVDALARLRPIITARLAPRALASVPGPRHGPRRATRRGGPTVAVILSNHNHAQYLPESLRAICGQTREADEIIVIDDGSIDDSVEIIEEFARRDDRIRFLRNPTNVGLQVSIGRVLPLVRSDYLVWAASDDRLLPTFLERSMALLERYPQAGLCFSELAVLRPESGNIQRFAIEPSVRHIFDLSDLPEYVTPAQLMRRMRQAYLPITSNSVVVRRDALLVMGGYPGELEWCSDSLAYMMIALRHGACVVPETLAVIRPSPTSYSSRGMRDVPRQRRVLGAILDLLGRPENRDVRRAFRACPSNFSPWQALMLRVQAGRPRDWDLLAPYLIWKIREYKRGHRLNWSRTAWQLGGRASRAVARRVRAKLSRVPRTLAPPGDLTNAPAARIEIETGGVSAGSASTGAPRNDVPAVITRVGLDGYTLLIMTYNRAPLLARLLDYLQHFKPSCPVVVLDSSMDEAREQNAAKIARSSLRVEHALYPSDVDPYVKIREGLGRVSTPFCSLCADDDIVVLPTLERCVAELERDRQAAVAHGYYFNFQEAKTFDLSYIVYRGGSLLADDPIVRLSDMFNAYEAVLYGVYQTPIAQVAFRRVDELRTVLGRELLTAALTAIGGRIVRVDGFYYGRNTGESLSYENWHPHEILTRSPEVLFQEYPRFRTIVLESLEVVVPGVSDGAAAEVLDLVFLRYLAPFLRADVIDLIIADRLRGESPGATLERLRDVFVRTPNRTQHPIEPLTGPEGTEFAPDAVRTAGERRDYLYKSRTVSGAMRQYRVLYEFLFPDSTPAPVVGRDQLMPLLGWLDAY